MLSNLTLSSNVITSFSYSFNVTADTNQTLYIRVYPYSIPGISSTTKYLYLQDVSIFGKTTGTVIASLPTLSTDNVTFISVTTATSGGTITSDGGGSLTERGVCWSLNNNPTIADSKTSDGIETGIFESHIANLTANTVYYLRAYATNSAGTAYGNETSLKL